MDRVWRFLRTIAWSSTGLVAVASILAVVNAVNEQDFIGAKALAAVGFFAVLGSAILAILKAALYKEPTTAFQRSVNQFLQLLIAGAPAPFFADTLLNTGVNYGKAWLTLLGVAIAGALQSYLVNAREADPNRATPLALPEDTNAR